VKEREQGELYQIIREKGLSQIKLSHGKPSPGKPSHGKLQRRMK